MAGDDDGIVDISTHLQCLDDQITQEIKGLTGDGGEGEIDPDTALDHDDQQNGKTHRLEGEQQDNDHEEAGQNGDDQIVCNEGR